MCKHGMARAVQLDSWSSPGLGVQPGTLLGCGAWAVVPLHLHVAAESRSAEFKLIQTLQPRLHVAQPSNATERETSRAYSQTHVCEGCV